MTTIDYDTNMNHDSTIQVVNDNTERSMRLDHQGSQNLTDIQSNHHHDFNAIWDDSFHGKFYGRHSEKLQILEAYRRVRGDIDTKESTNLKSSISELILIEGETVSLEICFFSYSKTDSIL
jgi:hypothetical protein